MTNMIYGGGAQALPDESFSFLELLPPAFRQENDVLNLFRLAGMRRPLVDLGFNALRELDTIADERFRQRNGIRLARAQSRPEFQAIQGLIVEEERDRQMLASGGWAGLAAGMLAGTLSPTVFLPLVGQARGARGVAQAFGLGAVGAAAAEIPLMAAQETRTFEEAAIGIAAGTVLGGLLGSTAVYLRQRDFARISEALDQSVRQQPTAMLVQRADGAIVRTGEQVPLQGLDVPVRRSFDVYHGTPEQGLRVTQLDPGRGVEVRGATFFSDAADTAAPYSFAREFGERVGEEAGAVLEARISFTNPLEVDLQGRQFDAVEGTRLVEQAKASGHDGLIVRNAVDSVDGTGAPSTTYAVFRKGQISERPPAVENAEAPAASPGASTGTSTVGAKSTRDLDIPVVEHIDPVTGARTWEPVISEAEAMQMDPALMVGELAARMNPIARLVQQWGAPIRSLVAARVGLRLSTGGISWRISDHGLAVARGGTVEDRLGFYQALKGRAYMAMQDAYSRYVLDKAPTTLAERALQRVRIEANSAPAGKMTFKEFSAGLTEAMNKGDTHAIPQIAEAAQFVRKEVMEAVLRTADEAAAEWGGTKLFKEIQFDQQHSYMMHSYSPARVAADQPGFIREVSAHIVDATRAIWERQIAKVRRKADADLTGADLFDLDREGAQRLFGENLATLEAMKEAADPRVGRIKELRREARDVVDEEVEALEAALARDPMFSVQTPDQAALDASLGASVTGRTNRTYLAGLSPKQLRDAARARVAEQRQSLLDEAVELEADLPRDVLAGIDEAKRLRQANRIIAKSFGRLEAKQEEALKRIEDNEILNINAFERVVTASQKFFRDLPGLDEAQLAAELKKLEEAWTTAWQAASRGDAKLDKLEEDLLLSGYSGRQLLEESMRQTGRAQRASRAFDKVSAAALRDRDALVAELRSRLDTSIEYVNRVNSKRSERNALLRQRIEALDPEAATAQARALRERAEGRFDALDERMLRAGADSAHSRTGDFTFEQAAKNYATDLSARIMGQTGRMAQIDAMAGVRGPFKNRHLNIPYDIKKAWLEEDFEKVLDRYLTTTGADVELYRAFGDRSGSRALFDVLEDLQAIRMELATRTVDEAGKSITEARRLKDLKAHDRGVNRRINEIEGTLERIRGPRGIPADPNSIAYRLGRFMLNFNVSRMMGSSALASIPDAGRTVMAHGLNHTFQKSWAPFVRGFTDEVQGEFNRGMKREMAYLNIGIDSFTQQRSRNMLDILEPMGRHTAAERGMEWLAQKTPVIALLGAWTDAMKQITGAGTVARFQRIMEETVEGRASQADLKFLAQNGLDANFIRRIWSEMETHGTKFETNGETLLLPNSSLWTDYDALRAYMAAMTRVDQQLIVTPGLEKPLWMDGSMLGRIVGQFRSFTMASNSKILVASLQARGPSAFYAAQGAVLSLGLGAVSYYLWAMTSSSRAREEMRNATWEQWTDQAIARSGLLGVFGEAQNIMQEMELTRGLVTLSDERLAGRRASSLVDAVAGPTSRTLGQMASFAQGLDDPTAGTVRNARQLLPWQNVFYLREAFTQIERATSATLGLPENRR